MNRYRAGAGAYGLLALAGVSISAAVLAPLYDHRGGPALMAELNHPVPLALLAVLALTAAAMLNSRRPDVRKGAGIALALAAVTGVLAVPVYQVGADPFPDLEFDVPAPDGSARRLVVEQTSPFHDPVWRIYVDAGHFPTTRRWPVAEFPHSPDDYPKGILDATWSPDASHITLTDLDHVPHSVRIAGNGRAVEGVGW